MIDILGCSLILSVGAILYLLHLKHLQLAARRERELCIVWAIAKSLEHADRAELNGLHPNFAERERWDAATLDGVAWSLRCCMHHPHVEIGRASCRERVCAIV